jgi:hypothetical protein
MDISQQLYNAEQKNLFIEDYIVTTGKSKQCNEIEKRKRAVKFLRGVSSFEYQHNKDFCTFKIGSEEMRSVYVGWLNNCSESTVRIAISILRQYVKWCYKKEIIDYATYASHALISKNSELYIKSDTEMSIPTKITSPVFLAQNISAMENESSVGDDFVFKTENGYFNYLNVLFEDDKYTMPAAVMTLFYYGFSIEEIRSLYRRDVDSSERRIQNVIIENETAMKLIERAKNLDSYVIIKEDGYKRTEYFMDSTRLIRNTSRGCGMVSEDQKIPKEYCHKMRQYQLMASKKLPRNSKYKNVFIKMPTVQKLRDFYKIYRDEQELGIEEVRRRFNNGTYNVQFDFYAYKIMASKARDI